MRHVERRAERFVGVFYRVFGVGSYSYGLYKVEALDIFVIGPAGGSGATPTVMLQQLQGDGESSPYEGQTVQVR